MTSDAEWARIVISDAEFDWFFSPEGEIVISDGSMRIARSIEELATCMKPILLRWRWAEPVKGGIFWSDVPQTKKEFISRLGLDDIFKN